MATLKNEIVKDRNIMNALHKLTQYPRFKPKTGMLVAKLVDAVKEKIFQLDDEFQTLAKANAKLTDKGEHIPRKGPDGETDIPGSFTPKDNDAWNKISEEFSQKKFDLKVDLIPIKELEGAGLTPYELKVLEPFISETNLSLT